MDCKCTLTTSDDNMHLVHCVSPLVKQTFEKTPWNMANLGFTTQLVDNQQNGFHIMHIITSCAWNIGGPRARRGRGVGEGTWDPPRSWLLGGGGSEIKNGVGGFLGSRNLHTHISREPRKPSPTKGTNVNVVGPSERSRTKDDAAQRRTTQWNNVNPLLKTTGLRSTKYLTPRGVQN